MKDSEDDEMHKIPISYYLPCEILNNDMLAKEYKNWDAEKIFNKTGIRDRHIAGDETALDMAEHACRQLFNEIQINFNEIEYIIFVTQTPDYILPTTACILQDRLNINTSVGALDINLGCSGYIYGLSLVKGLIEGNIVRNVLLVTSETYSKHINPLDKSTRTIFGDAATATFITHKNYHQIKNFVFGTDGSGYSKLIIPAGGGKNPANKTTKIPIEDESGYVRSQENLYMDGIGIFNFTMEITPTLVSDVLMKNSLSIEEIDLFIFHQANRFILESIRSILDIPEEKMFINIENIGNTVSSSIPIALKMAYEKEKLKQGMKVMLVGFGVGLSWSATIIEFDD